MARWRGRLCYHGSGTLKTNMAKRKYKKPAKRLLSHHRHTGKMLHHRHTSYPLVVLLLLMVGVFLAHATLQVRAATVKVTAVANGPLPPGPAVITNPKTGDRFRDIPIPVSGTCPYPYFVKLFRNQVFSGSTQCKSDGTFLIYTDLFEGKNDLEARIYNAADQEGPRSNIVTVYYDIPVPVTPPSESLPPGERGRPPTGVQEPFFITTDVFFKAVYDNQAVQWRFGIVGGKQPYHITVAWGDGSTSTLQNIRGKAFTVRHVYRKGAETREFYPVAVSVTDSKGRKATLQVFTVLNNRLIPGLGSTAPDELPPDSSLWRRLLMAWPVYVVTVLMAVSFWLGEHRGFLIWDRAARRFKNHRPRPRRA
jgi:hypothetical protein